MQLALPVFNCAFIGFMGMGIGDSEIRYLLTWRSGLGNGLQRGGMADGCIGGVVGDVGIF